MKMIADRVGAEGSDSQTFSLASSLFIEKQIFVLWKRRRGWWGKVRGYGRKMISGSRSRSHPHPGTQKELEIAKRIIEDQIQRK
jgi:hypothetical protein